MTFFEIEAPRRVFQAVRGKLQAAFRTPRVWFLAEHHVPLTDLPEPPAVEDLPGLIFHHQLDPDEAGTCFISYWESCEDFEASRGPLERSLGGALLHRAAWVRRAAVERRPLWKRVTAYGVLLHVVAILGALAALEEYQAWLFEEPMVGLELESGDPVNIVAGLPLRTHLVLSNQRANATARISGLSARIQGPNTAASIPLEDAHYLGKAGDLRLPFRTRALAVPGEYTVTVSGNSESGLLQESKPLLLERSVLVWSRDPQVSVALASDSPSRAELKGLIRVGEDAPAGVDCFITLVKEPGLRFGPMHLRGMANWPAPTVSRDGTVSNQSWTTPPVRGFTKVAFSLYMEGRPASEWHQVLKNIMTECFVSTKEG